MEELRELINIIKCPGVKGLSGRYVVGDRYEIQSEFKKCCEDEEIKMTSFESIANSQNSKLNEMD